VESGCSKLIVYEEDIDNICGFIHSQEMFRLHPGDDWHEHIREVPIVPETMSAQKLMQMLMQQKKSLAVVVDEFGGTSGICTLEDLVEEIFGDIEDEHDQQSYVARKLPSGEFELSARLEIEKANELLGLDLPESDDYLTVGGLLLHELQRFPKLNEVCRFSHFEFKIVKTTNTKIELVRLHLTDD
jgi:CBS domain containing-hemolysin-like protein